MSSMRTLLKAPDWVVCLALVTFEMPSNMFPSSVFQHTPGFAKLGHLWYPLSRVALWAAASKKGVGALLF